MIVEKRLLTFSEVSRAEGGGAPANEIEAVGDVSSHQQCVLAKTVCTSAIHN